MNSSDLLISPMYHWFPGNIYNQQRYESHTQQQVQVQPRPMNTGEKVILSGFGVALVLFAIFALWPIKESK